MNRVKIMLMTVAILAVAGGALAFKASNRYDREFCTTITTGSTCPLSANLTCPNYVVGQHLTTGVGFIVCTTTPPADEDCTPNGVALPCSIDNPIKITDEFD